MNATITSPIIDNTKVDIIFIGIAFVFFFLLFCGLLKMVLVKGPINPQIAVLIEIPIAVSISTQTVDNEYIGTVI